MSKDKKGGDEFVLMRQIYDNLQYLDYEVDFDPIKRRLPYLSDIYFAVPGQSAKEQFDYFAGLSIWLMQTYLKSSIETPSEFDQPTSVADSLIVSLPAVGFKLNFSSSKLISGSGLAVCTILDAIVRKSLKAKGFSPQELRCTSGTGGEEKMDVVGEDDDDDGIIDDAVDIQEDDDNESSQVSNIDYSTNDQSKKIVDSLELKKEFERVAPRLRISIPSAKTDWRNHFQQMNQYQSRISDIMSELSPLLSKVGSDVSKAISLIDTRESTLNNRFETTIVEYATRASALASVSEKHKRRQADVAALQDELNETISKLEGTKNKLDEKSKEVSDNSPLLKMRSAINNIKEEIQQLELRSAILQRTLTQGWIDEKDKELEEQEKHI